MRTAQPNAYQLGFDDGYQAAMREKKAKESDDLGAALEAAQAERDAMLAIVRAADTMHLKPTMDNINAWLEARAKWGGE